MDLKTFTIKSPNGLSATLSNYGARMMSLFVPEGNGGFRNVILGFKTAEEYFLADEKYFGAIVGRCCNRISNGRFDLEGISYQLAKNINGHHLHGGINAFHTQIWEGRQVAENAVEFRYFSEDGEEGYPGNLTVLLMYSIVGREMHLTIRAATDKTTVVNITAHPYFNLLGEGNGSILDHELYINAEAFTPVNESVIPTGEIKSVKNTPFDFSSFHRIGERINEDDPQLKIGHGYDHNLVLKKQKPGGLELAAIVKEPVSGLAMDLWTTEPGIQFYSSNWLSGKDVGYSGKTYKAREAFCLETQHFPDSPNQLDFPRVLLFAGEHFESRTIFKFSY